MVTSIAIEAIVTHSEKIGLIEERLEMNKPQSDLTEVEISKNKIDKTELLSI
jgi:hypothetical protein